VIIDAEKLIAELRKIEQNEPRGFVSSAVRLVRQAVEASMLETDEDGIDEDAESIHDPFS
jgi:hypothetical protein